MRRILYKIFRYGILKRLRPGERIMIIPSWACNYGCEYCSLKVDSVYPKSSIRTLEEWKQYISDISKAIKVREIVLSGGEPTLLPYFKELTTWILEQGFFLTIYSNLSNDKLLDVPQSVKVRVAATYHETQANIFDFMENYKKVNKKLRVDAVELGDNPMLPYSRTLPFLTSLQLSSRIGSIQIGPQFTMALTYRSGSEHYTK